MSVELADSNMALVGSDIEKEVKARAAETEEAWEGAGAEDGIEKWRVANMGVHRDNEGKLNTLYGGDCYILLRTYTDGESDAKLYDVHFWLGAECSQDESTVAAYKTVELDDRLGSTPVQFREVMGHESQAFLDLFGGRISILKGGIDSAFNHVEPESYVPRLLHCKGKGVAVRVTEVPKECGSLNSGDAFVLDAGTMIYAFYGSEAGMFEKRKGGEIANELKDDRNVDMEIVDGMDDENEGFWEAMGGKGEIGEAGEEEAAEEGEKALYKLSNDSGALTCEKLDDFSRDALTSEDAFIVDCGYQLFAYIGADASKEEKANVMQYAVGFLSSTGRPTHTPIQRIVQGGETASFNSAFD